MHNQLISIYDGLTAANSDGHTSHYFVFNIYIFLLFITFRNESRYVAQHLLLTMFETVNVSNTEGKDEGCLMP